jgi:para-nitrobenzyl esterase
MKPKLLVLGFCFLSAHWAISQAVPQGGATAATAPEVPRVQFSSGVVRGETEGGASSFKGIPYAKAPIGDLRWRPPQPLPPWQGERDATRFGADCPQVAFGPGAGSLPSNTSEDCLFLNVWKPAGAAPTAKLPVMVWIHGGAFLLGSGSQPAYSGIQFAKQGIILVTFNYRLGRLGFFAFPALTREHPDELKGNYAYMDQIAALTWVRQNIAAFGGDPGNVTLFGESAGGISVHALLTSPLAGGLFHKAIIESGAGRDGILTGCPMAKDGPKVMSAETIGVSFARKHGIRGADGAALAKLRALSAQDVISEGETAPFNSDTYSGPILDGRLAVETVQSAYESGHQARVPLMIGANNADASFFVYGDTKDAVFSLFGKRKAEAMAAYDPDGSIDLKTLISLAGADRIQSEPARFTARAFTAKGVPVYVYRFSYVQEAMRQVWPDGAPHASEIPYVFDTLGTAAFGTQPLQPSREDQAVARKLNSYWVNFARTGNPNGPGLPNWPSYQPNKDEILDFRPDGSQLAAPDPWKARLDLAEYMSTVK